MFFLDSKKQLKSFCPEHPSNTKLVMACAWHANHPRRRTMEDAHDLQLLFPVLDDDHDTRYSFMAVYDGHGGAQAAKFAKDQLPGVLKANLELLPTDPMRALRNACIEIDDKLISGTGDSGSSAACGTTAALCLIDWQLGKLVSANVGDSRVIMIDKHRKQAKRLSFDHKSSDPWETARVRELGGNVCFNRVSSVLSVSRALGDADIKEFVRGNPFTVECDLENVHVVVIACDGVWDVVGDEEASECVLRVIDSNDEGEGKGQDAKDTMTQDDPVNAIKETVKRAAEALTELAIRKDTMDNVSVAVGLFLS